MAIEPDGEVTIPLNPSTVKGVAGMSRKLKRLANTSRSFERVVGLAGMPGDLDTWEDWLKVGWRLAWRGAKAGTLFLVGWWRDWIISNPVDAFLVVAAGGVSVWTVFGIVRELRAWRAPNPDRMPELATPTADWLDADMVGYRFFTSPLLGGRDFEQASADALALIESLVRTFKRDHPEGVKTDENSGEDIFNEDILLHWIDEAVRRETRLPVYAPRPRPGHDTRTGLSLSAIGRSGEARFDYSNNDGIYTINPKGGTHRFDTVWTERGTTSIYARGDGPMIQGVGALENVMDIAQVADAHRWKYIPGSMAIEVGGVAIFRNKAGNYLAVQILGIEQTKVDIRFAVSDSGDFSWHSG